MGRAGGGLARAGHDFPTGPVDLELIRQLERWQRQPRGARTVEQQCEFCATRWVEAGAIFVPTEEALFVAPRLVTHYIRKHGYAPPPEFVRALREFSGDLNAALARYDTSEFNVPYLFDVGSPEPARRNPERVVASTGTPGHHALLDAFVRYSLNQHIWGGATRLRVDVDEAGWVTVEDDGLGIRDAPLPLESIFLRRGMVGRRLDVASPRFAIWWAGGPPLAVSCALSSRMEVESRRGGSVLRVAFECGRVVEPTVRVGDTTLHGLRVRYQADPVLFDAGSRLDLQLVERDLTTLAWLCPQLDVVLQGRSLQRGTGPAGWVQELAPDAVKETALTATGSAEEVAVEVSLAWAPGRTAPRLESFMNYAAAGGPEAGLLEALRAAAVQRGADPEHVVRGIVAVVHVGAHGSRDARKAVREVVARAIDATPWWWDRLNEVIPVTSPAVRGAP